MRPTCYTCQEEAVHGCENCPRQLCDRHAVDDESMGVHLCEPCAQELDREWQENHAQEVRDAYA